MDDLTPQRSEGINPLSIGFLAGLLFGLVALLLGLPKALLVLGCGVLGLLIGAGLQAIQLADLDLRGAAQTLLRRPKDGL